MDDRTVVAHGCRKTKKIICGMEVENVVAYGRCLPPLVLAGFVLIIDYKISWLVLCSTLAGALQYSSWCSAVL